MMTVDAFLAQYRTLLKRISDRTARLKLLNAQMDSIVSIWGEHISAHTQDPPYVKLVEQMDHLREDLKKDEDLLPYLQAQVMDLIYALPEAVLVDVMVHRYLDGMSYWQIGNTMHMDKGSAKRHQTRACALLSVPSDPILI